MTKKEFCQSVNRMYFYADMLKAIHLSTDKHWIHNYCDHFQNDIRAFLDELCEQYFGYYGRPQFSDFSFKDVDVYEEKDLSKLLKHVMDVVTPIQEEVKDIPQLSGLVSLIDDFKGILNKNVYLSTFDKMSSYMGTGKDSEEE